VVRFENLTGDPALDWAGREASEVLAISLAGAMDGPVLNPAALRRMAPALGNRPASAPGSSSERDSALLSGATRLISGYMERSGNALRVVAVDEDLATGKILRTVSARSASTPPNTLLLLQQLAHEFSPRARPYLTSNPKVAEDYFKGVEAPLAASEASLKEAIALDPDYGPAWLGLTKVAELQRDRNSAENWISQARTHKLDPYSMAELDSEAAALGSGSDTETQTAKIAATRKLSALSPGDINLLRSLAESESATGQFAAAAADWKKLADILPGDAAVWNSLGYARSWAGDFPGALTALNEYRRLRPNDPNALDSIGDLYYLNRKFNEAAANYLQGNTKDPNFQRFGELYKAAWAKFMAGDKPGADALFAKFRAAREKASDPLVPLLIADWLYRTGHAEDAVAGLRKAVGEMQPATLRAEGYTQLAIWDLLAGDRAQAQKDAMAAGQPTTPVVAMMWFVIQPSASAGEWQQRADRINFPAQLRRLALGYALLLDGKRDAATPVWKEIVNSTPATDFFSRAVYARLRKQSDEKPLIPEPNQVNQFSALLAKL
jgi:tetratricopeptide (TPR) repeat protein